MRRQMGGTTKDILAYKVQWRQRLDLYSINSLCRPAWEWPILSEMFLWKAVNFPHKSLLGFMKKARGEHLHQLIVIHIQIHDKGREHLHHKPQLTLTFTSPVFSRNKKKYRSCASSFMEILTVVWKLFVVLCDAMSTVCRSCSAITQAH